jgi:fatty acid desaturase
LPALLAPTFMLFTNYIQHVHCDPTSPDRHSRNFVSPSANWLTFDNGYHTVHHDRPSVHWSQYASLHAARAASLHPSLNRHSVLSFCLETYVLGAFWARFRTRPLSPTEPFPMPEPASPAVPRGAHPPVTSGSAARRPTHAASDGGGGVHGRQRGREGRFVEGGST